MVKLLARFRNSAKASSQHRVLSDCSSEEEDRYYPVKTSVGEKVSHKICNEGQEVILGSSVSKFTPYVEKKSHRSMGQGTSKTGKELPAVATGELETTRSTAACSVGSPVECSENGDDHSMYCPSAVDSVITLVQYPENRPLFKESPLDLGSYSDRYSDTDFRAMGSDMEDSVITFTNHPAPGPHAGAVDLCQLYVSDTDADDSPTNQDTDLPSDAEDSAHAVADGTSSVGMYLSDTEESTPTPPEARSNMEDGVLALTVYTGPGPDDSEGAVNLCDKDEIGLLLHVNNEDIYSDMEDSVLTLTKYAAPGPDDSDGALDLCKLYATDAQEETSPENQLILRKPSAPGPDDSAGASDLWQLSNLSPENPAPVDDLPNASPYDNGVNGEIVEANKNTTSTDPAASDSATEPSSSIDSEQNQDSSSVDKYLDDVLKDNMDTGVIFDQSISSDESELLKLIQEKQKLQNRLRQLQKNDHGNQSQQLKPPSSEYRTLQQKPSRDGSINSKTPENKKFEFLSHIDGVEIHMMSKESLPNSDENQFRLILRVLVSHYLEIIILEWDMRVVSAKFWNEKEQSLYLPKLEDLVEMNHFGHASLSGLVENALGRLRLWEQRKTNVESLSKEANCNVKVCRNPKDPDDDLFQKVIVSFALLDKDKSTLEASLRVTPNCPRVVGGVFLESLSTHNEAMLTSTRKLMQRATCYIQGQQTSIKTPTELIQMLQRYLHLGLASIQ